MSARKPLRAVFTVQFDRRLDGWVVLAGNVPICLYSTRKIAERWGKTFADSAWTDGKLHESKRATHTLCAQLRTRNRAGAWGKERTYGFDPKRRKG